MAKRDTPIIRFEEADYSKGSHKPVIWTCPDCKQEFQKAYKNALRSKRCKPCNNIVRPKPDYSGKNNPFYGKRHSQEVKDNLKGENNPAWNGGLPTCKECGQELSDRRSQYCPKHFQLGPRNPKWNPTYDRAKREHLRITPEYTDWAKQVKERDNFTCRDCGQIGGRLHSHHLKLFSTHPELRYDVDNGITLCRDCHCKVHDRFIP